ncbi:MAG TPA: Do family serine endopeptidase [Gammaproteobacteria bacterium]|nr:Do family serine endopeptidase [Gammaproteobacteria bacterium]
MAETTIRTRAGRLCGALLLFGLAAASAQQRVVEPLPSLAPLVEEVAPAVVNISVAGTAPLSSPFSGDPLLERFFGDQLQQRPLRGEGSGVIVDAEDGYLLTNHHVIENADEITVSLLDGRSFVATVVGSDADSDLAVLKIDGDNLSDIPFASDDDLRVGDYVVAIGNPLGFENTVTAGIVSGLGRSGLSRDRDPNRVYEDFIQTDASINVGNSGGALVNLRGELVGINSAIISQTGGNIGIGLAIPTRMAVPVMEQIIEFGEVRRGLLGVTMSTMTPDQAEEYGVSVSEGALVTEVVPDSAAEAAGIQIFDVIVGLNGQRIANSNELRNRIGLMRPGDEVEVDLIRNGRRLSLTATLGLRTDEVLSRTEGSDISDPVFEGIELAEVQRGGIRGLGVVSVVPGSPAGNQGLLEGDIITFINRQPVTTLAEARAIVAEARFVLVQIQRGNRSVLIRLR